MVGTWYLFHACKKFFCLPCMNAGPSDDLKIRGGGSRYKAFWSVRSLNTIYFFLNWAPPPSPLSDSPEMEDHAVECEISIIPKLKRAKLFFKSHVNLGNPTNCRSGFEFQYTNITIFWDIFCYMILYKSRKCLKCDFRKMLPHCLNFLCSQRWL